MEWELACVCTKYALIGCAGTKFAPIGCVGTKYAPIGCVGTKFAPIGCAGTKYAPIGCAGTKYAPIGCTGTKYAPIARALLTRRAGIDLCYRRKFDLAYFLAKENLFFSKMAPLSQLKDKHGVDLGSSYENN